jgi:predicted neutral ceramidase superfamily lipid hydrolase
MNSSIKPNRLVISTNTLLPPSTQCFNLLWQSISPGIYRKSLHLINITSLIINGAICLLVVLVVTGLDDGSSYLMATLALVLSIRLQSRKVLFAWTKRSPYSYLKSSLPLTLIVATASKSFASNSKWESICTSCSL